jgi:hypothetical protein
LPETAIAAIMVVLFLIHFATCGRRLIETLRRPLFGVEGGMESLKIKARTAASSSAEPEAKAERTLCRRSSMFWRALLLITKICALGVGLD